MSNTLTSFYLIRHGETEWNVAKRVQGNSDSPLTENGLLQARDLAKELKKIKFDLAFSSDLLRAKRTAEIITLEHELAVATTDTLRERNFGKFEGKSNTALKTLFELLDKMEENLRFSYSEGDMESDEEVVTRLITFLRETAIANPGKNILTVSHGGVLRMLLIHTGYGTYKSIKHIANTAYIKLETDGSDIFVRETKGIDIL